MPAHSETPGINARGHLNLGNVACTSRVNLGVGPQLVVDNETGAVTINGQVFAPASAAALALTFAGPCGTQAVAARLSRVGAFVTLELAAPPPAAATGAAVFASAAGAVPPAFRPATPSALAWPVLVTSGGAPALGTLELTSGGTITVAASIAGGAFAPAGAAGWPGTLAVAYTTA